MPEGEIKQEGINVDNNGITTSKKLGGVTGKGFMPGQTGNPGGRPKKPMKEFSMQLFKSMTQEEKLAFLEKINPVDRWKMTEGNPANETDITTDGESINPLTPEQIAKLNELLK
jgi:hypothetical protein